MTHIPAKLRLELLGLTKPLLALGCPAAFGADKSRLRDDLSQFVEMFADISPSPVAQFLVDFFLFDHRATTSSTTIRKVLPLGNHEAAPYYVRTGQFHHSHNN